MKLMLVLISVITAIETESELYINVANIADTRQELLEEILTKVHDQDKRIKYIENKLLDCTALFEKTTESLGELELKTTCCKSSSRIVRDTDKFEKTAADINSLQRGAKLGVLGPILENHHFLKSRSLSQQRIAFSAYLGKTLEHVSIGQVIKCDAILLNDGNAYNPDRGVFTASENGVYMFSFAVASTKQTYVKLLVDGLNTAGVVVNGLGYNKTAMASNTILVRVSTGQSVWLENYINNDVTLISFGPFIYTSFSGYLLY